MELIVSTCGLSARAVSTVVRLYSRCPTNGGALLATQAAAFEPCSWLVFDVHAAGTYWIVVEGATTDVGTPLTLTYVDPNTSYEAYILITLSEHITFHLRF